MNVNISQNAQNGYLTNILIGGRDARAGKITKDLSRGKEFWARQVLVPGAHLHQRTNLNQVACVLRV